MADDPQIRYLTSKDRDAYRKSHGANGPMTFIIYQFQGLLYHSMLAQFISQNKRIANRVSNPCQANRNSFYQLPQYEREKNQFSQNKYPLKKQPK